MEGESLKEKYRNYLSTLNIHDLRCYGRFLQLQQPTKMKKAPLIEDIIRVLCDEITPLRNRRGAPVKNMYCDPNIHYTLQKLSNKQLEAPPAYTSQTIHFPQTVNIHLSIQPSTLNQEQLKKLTDFLLSLQ